MTVMRPGSIAASAALLMLAGCEAGSLPFLGEEDPSALPDAGASFDDEGQPADASSMIPDARDARFGDLRRPPDLAHRDLEPMADMPPRDLTVTGITCGNQTCPIGQICCVTGTVQNPIGTCDRACPQGALAVKCSGPEHCGGNPCCAILANVNNQPTVTSVDCAMGPKACNPLYDVPMKTGETRLCHIDADCSRDAPTTELPSCCTGRLNGQAAQFCFNPLYLKQVQNIACP